nr:unnamed protein product [Spirometra erinaceieuropaei]
MDGNPQHLRHTEANSAALERPPGAHGRRVTTQTTLLRRRREGFSPSRRPDSPLQGYPEVLPEMPANQPTNWDELALDRPTWRRTVKTGAAIYEANRIAAAKAKREARKSQLRPVSNAAAQPLPTCPRCQRTFRARIGPVGHLRINCASRTAPTIVPHLPLPPPLRRQLTLTILLTQHFHHPPPPSHPPPPPPPRPLPQRRPLRRLSHAQQPTLPPPPPTPGMRIRTTPALTATVPSPHTSAWHRMGLFGHMRIHESGLDRTPDTHTTSNTSTVHTPTLVPSVRDTTTTTASSVADTDTADFSCPHCPRTFTSRIGLVGHLRIHRRETGEPVPGAPTYTHQARLNCPHCPRNFRHRMSLFGHMRIHDDLR